MKIAVIDYGASNLQSVANALTVLGQDFKIVSEPEGLAQFDKVILPGVGAAGSAMEKLTKSGFAEIVPKLKVPTLGVCLGLQLFADSSEENNTKDLLQNNIMVNFSEFRPFGQKNFSAYLSGKHQNLFCPTASKFRKIISKAYFAKGLKCLSIIPGQVKRFETELKVPQMGWNKVEIIKESSLTANIPNNSFFYFVHSYYLETRPELVIGQTIYDITFPAIVQKDNFYATQFHPEKSGKWGMKLLSNFCDL